MIEAAALIAQARQWVGVPFLHQGRTRHGADCLGSIAGILTELGSRTLIDKLPINYARTPQQLLIDGLNQFCREIPLQPAALLLIHFPRAEFPSHAGIYTGVSMIHCYQSEGKVVEHRYAEPWIKRTASVWALPLVKYLPQDGVLTV